MKPTLLILFLFWACENGRVVNKICKKNDEKCFKDLIYKTNFHRNVSVLWYPELPTENDEILIIYNTKSKHSRFSKHDALKFRFTSYASGEFTKAMNEGEDGLLWLRLKKSNKPKQGFLTFSSNKTMDNNYGSPWKLAIVDKHPKYRKITTPKYNYYYHKSIKQIWEIIMRHIEEEFIRVSQQLICMK